MQIEEYRTRLDTFAETLNRELYQYNSGLKDHPEIASLYSDSSDFFSPDAGELCREIGLGELEHQVLADESSEGLRR